MTNCNQILNPFTRYLNLHTIMNEQQDCGKENSRPNEDKKPYVIVPDQLSNEALLVLDREKVDTENRIFPTRAIVDERGRLIDPFQFIVAGKGRNIDKLQVGKVFVLKSVDPDTLKPKEGDDAREVQVTVLKSRKSAPHGKRYVLLEAPASIIGLEDATLGIYRNATEEQDIGILHPVETHTGGGQSHSVMPYGVSLLVTMKANHSFEPLSEIRTQSRTATFEQDAELGTATIAVLDSGIRFRGSSRRSTSCSDVGWDFVTERVPGGDPFPDDNHPGLHGTKICTIIKNEAPGAGILPVKVSNSNGRLTLYDALCGLEYARTHGAKVVNASWSFTADGNNGEEKDFPLLLQAIRDLEESGIIVVAAAGNKSQYVNPDGHIGTNGAPKIYPACYSAIQDNVITVTTVAAPNLNAAPTNEDSNYRVVENYSNKFVDTGAVANAEASATDGEFTIPGFLDSYEGTSFATPYVAAKIAQIIYFSPGYTGKRTLLRRLREFHIESKLADKIRDGGSYITV